MRRSQGSGARRRLLAAGAVILALGGLLVLFTWLGGGEVEAAPDYSSFSYGPRGVRAFHDVLRDLGLNPIRLNRRWKLSRMRGVLFLVEPEAEFVFQGEGHGNQVLASDEVDSLLEWVEAGNTCVVLAADLNELYARLGCRPAGPLVGGLDPKATLLPPLWPGELFRDVKGVAFPPGSSFQVQGGEHTPLLGDPSRPAALVLPRGKGLFYLVADPWPVTNRGIQPHRPPGNDAALWLCRLAAIHSRGGGVFLDETHHGFRGELTVMGFFQRHGVHYAVAHLALVFVLLAWRLGAGFGEPVVVRSRAGREVSEYVGAMASIYQRARLAPEAMRAVIAGLRRDLVTHLRLPPRCPADTLRAELKRVSEAQARQLDAVLTRARTIHPRSSPQEFVETCRMVLRLREEITRGRKRREPAPANRRHAG